MHAVGERAEHTARQNEAEDERVSVKEADLRTREPKLLDQQRSERGNDLAINPAEDVQRGEQRENGPAAHLVS